MKRIYLDNASTTQLDEKVIAEMNKAMAIFGNPSSLHTFGQEARKLVDEARDAVANFLNCKPTEVVFTSGGSESDNLAIRGIVDSIQITDNSKPHIIASAIEHHAVLHTIQDLEKEEKIEATYVKPNKKGVIEVGAIERAIKDNTVLVSIMYVNNEIGTIQPIREIGKMIERVNARRSKNTDNRIQITERGEKTVSCILSPVYFHTDAVQGAEYLNMDTKYLHVDLLSLSAHKIHGPKGVGVLCIKKGTPIEQQIIGGEQEFGLRAGTENTTAICGMKAAIAEIRNPKSEIRNKSQITNSKFETIRELRDELENNILKNIPETYLNGDKTKRAAHISNISFKNAEGEAIILNLDFKGIAVSSGSACTSRSLEPSHVLSAMGVPHELSHGAIRFSLSKYTTKEEIDKVLEALPGIIAKLRQMSPFGE